MAENRAAAILGAGTWGLTLACLLKRKGVDVLAWDAYSDYIEMLRVNRKHPKLPELEVPADLELTDDFAQAARADVLTLTVASHALRDVCERLNAEHPDWSRQRLTICSKGIERETLQPMAAIALETLAGLDESRLCVLSGPSHAEEVAREMPTTVVAASSDPQCAEAIQALFMTPRFRVYTHDDMLGVELGGSLKNVIAIAAGLCDGLGFGDNTRAALITRGLVEMTRLGVAMGAKAETFAGLTGMGDLIVTAGSRHSRNRNFGEKIAQGKSAQQAQAEIGMVVEGVNTCESTMALAKKYGVEMPIASAVYAVLHHRKNPLEAGIDLMLRDAKPEVAT